MFNFSGNRPACLYQGILVDYHFVINEPCFKEIKNRLDYIVGKLTVMHCAESLTEGNLSLFVLYLILLFF
jgi:hypothetical protein